MDFDQDAIYYTSIENYTEDSEFNVLLRRWD